MVSIKTGEKTSIASVLEELKVTPCTETNGNISMITTDSDQVWKTKSTKNDDSNDANRMTKETIKQQNAMPNSVSECAHTSPRFGKRLEFKIAPLCVQDPFELVHNLTQNITMETLKFSSP